MAHCKSVILALVAVALVAGCASAPPVPQAVVPPVHRCSNSWPWNAVSGYTTTDRGATGLFAVGIWTDSGGDLGLGRDLARTMSLKNLAGSIRAKSAGLTRAFREILGTKVSPGELKRFGDAVATEFTAEMLEGAVSPQTCDDDPDRHFVFSILDAAGFAAAVQNLQISEAMRNEVRNHADEAFARLGGLTGSGMSSTAALDAR